MKSIVVCVRLPVDIAAVLMDGANGRAQGGIARVVQDAVREVATRLSLSNGVRWPETQTEAVERLLAHGVGDQQRLRSLATTYNNDKKIGQRDPVQDKVQAALAALGLPNGGLSPSDIPPIVVGQGPNATKKVEKTS